MRLRAPTIFSEPILPVLEATSTERPGNITNETYRNYRPYVLFDVNPTEPSLQTTYLTIDEYQPSLISDYTNLRSWIFNKHSELVESCNGLKTKEDRQSLLSDLREAVRTRVSELDKGSVFSTVAVVSPEFTRPLVDTALTKAVEIFQSAAIDQAGGKPATNEWLKSINGWRAVRLDGSFKDTVAHYADYLNAAKMETQKLERLLHGEAKNGGEVRHYDRGD